MTNADKYLKEGISARKLFIEFKRYGIRHKCYLETDEFEEFMQEEVKPTLTEDERVILRNIANGFVRVGKDEWSKNFYAKRKIVENAADYEFLTCFNHLFQFIKERRRI